MLTGDKIIAQSTIDFSKDLTSSIGPTREEIEQQNRDIAAEIEAYKIQNASLEEKNKILQ
jgi:hypothetical protein